MGLESAANISELNASWPLGSDPKSEGDNHIRLIKQVLQAELQGFADLQDMARQSCLPVGAIFLSAVATDPATLLGFGTWEQVSKGRVLIGAGESSEDGNGDTLNPTLGDEAGVFNQGLTAAQLPKHRHGVFKDAQVNTLTQPGANQMAAAFKSNGGDANYQMQIRSDNFSTATGTNAGSTSDGYDTGLAGERHNNIQPFLAVMIWQRTA